VIVSRWAEHRPDEHGGDLPAGFAIRPARPDDCPTIAALEQIRGDVTLPAGEARCHRQLGDSTVLLLVATIDAAVVAFARAGRFTPPADAPQDIAPAGWYLFGVVVPDAWRRRGIGRALTVARLDWIRERASAAYYFTDAQNRASLDLHAALGFEEVARASIIAANTFDGGLGVLCRMAWGAPHAGETEATSGPS
jgi:ribosomal protein S18 acetylase RimI-like enzyme